MNLPTTRIVHPERAEFDDVVETLCAAFHDYPVMRYVLKDAGSNYDDHLRELVGWFTFKRVARGLPVLGVKRGDRMLGAANIDPPHPAPATAEMQDRYRRFAERIGHGAMVRFQAFADACAPLTPQEPHYYLGMLGVRPEAQGEGLSRLLLDTLHTMSARDTESTGVVLTTETPENLPFYNHFGYRVLGRAHAEELDTWTLFRAEATG